MPDAIVHRLGVFVAPHTGGIYSFYQKLSDVLRGTSIEAFSVELDVESSIWNEYAPELAGDEHKIVNVDGVSGVDASHIVADWLIEHGVDTILLTPMTPGAVYDALPHLPASIRVLVRLTEISRHSYHRALRRSEAVDAIIALCPRQLADIESVSPATTRYLLPNGVDTTRFSLGDVGGGAECPIRLLVLDRLVHLQKRILLLPQLCRELDAQGISYHLTVAGDGPDAKVLGERLVPWIRQGSVELVGCVTPDEVPAIMRTHHIYLKLSKNEGSPNAVLEAMAAGLATVTTRIAGVTDFVVDENITGFLVPIDDMPEMARVIGKLDSDRALLADCRNAARIAAVERFSLSCFRENLLELLDGLPASSKRSVKPWSQWHSSTPGVKWFLAPLKRLVPLSIRIMLREHLSKLAKVVGRT